MKKLFKYFTLLEWVIWLGSLSLIFISYFAFKNDSVIKLITSIIGSTALILNAKGNPIGMALIVVFSLLYGYISFDAKYYGEMLTYLLMSCPMAIYSLIVWIKNPYKNSKLEVKVKSVTKNEMLIICLLSLIVTFVFYFILKFLGTSSLYVSTFSVTTSFLAVCLTSKRSPYYALAYALNDIVLIVLWGIATFSDINYLSVVICFVAFLVNDLYAFINWKKIQKRQNGK